MSLLGPVFLFGGGWDGKIWNRTFARFLAAAVRGGRRKVAVIVVGDEDVPEQQALASYRRIFATLGVPADEVAELPVSPDAPLTRTRLAEARPTGVLVGGGLTPAYHAALCLDRTWLAELHEQGLPYGGFSAGAAIAAKRALLGGWKALREGVERSVTPPEAAEDLELLEVRDGLGLVPFAVEAHASQWGTLTRLLQAVDLGLVPDGWAIDEDTLLEVRGGRIEVHGQGHAYRIERGGGGRLEVAIHCAARDAGGT